ncbi:MAG: amidohydrolase family protein [Planctomycetes bacterium]|nr:amidohydrolase family protein [Planctomycetota bacterium]
MFAVRAWRIQVFAAAALLLSNGVDAGSVIAIKARLVCPVSGPAIERGVVLIEDGRVTAIGTDVAIPEGAKVIDAPDGVVTPGLIDACCVVDPEIEENGAYFRSRFSCPDCAELYRRHLKATNGGATVGHTLSERDLCPRCRAKAAAEAPAASLWREVAGKAAAAEFLPADGTVSLRADEHEGHNHGGGDICAGICGGPNTAKDDASPFAAVITTPRTTWAEHSSEVVPHTLVVDSVNLLSSDFERLLRSGITTVYVAPDSASVIGARGAIVHTGGDLAKRIVRSADAVKATMGSDPSYRGRSNMMPAGGYADMHTRRPTTRMGVDFVFRKAFYDADRWQNGIPLHGADTAPAAAFPVLQKVRAGEIPLRVQARMQHDIISALRLAHEFGLKITLDEGTEAYKCIPELKATGTAVIYGPLFMAPPGARDFVNEAENPLLTTPKLLSEAGIPFAITAQEMRDEESLIRQAMVAARYGLPAEIALKSVTLAAANLLRLPESFGVIKQGAEADLVVWSGDPLKADSRVRTVVIGGQVVLEN